MTYQWGKPSSTNAGMLQGQASPADKSLNRPGRRPGAEGKLSCPDGTLAVIPRIIELIRFLKV
ncbi:MAG: hypothetical protein J7M32_10970 [Deltaproteobacteria bacterium]|nr:hypothetical protein [Deltaproteobacteria bacterium]